MVPILKRPIIKCAPLNGIFRCEYFQTAYVTNDLERACEIFTRRYGIQGFHALEESFENGSAMSVRLAWIGGHMIEIIQARGPGMEFYNDRLPAKEFAIGHHHLGYLLPDEQTWRELQIEIAESGWNVIMDEDLEGLFKVRYVEARELGHYMEFFLLKSGGIKMFEAVPAS